MEPLEFPNSDLEQLEFLNAGLEPLEFPNADLGPLEIHDAELEPLEFPKAIWNHWNSPTLIWNIGILQRRIGTSGTPRCDTFKTSRDTLVTLFDTCGSSRAKDSNSQVRDTERELLEPHFGAKFGAKNVRSKSAWFHGNQKCPE